MQFSVFLLYFNFLQKDKLYDNSSSFNPHSISLFGVYQVQLSLLELFSKLTIKILSQLGGSLGEDFIKFQS